MPRHLEAPFPESEVDVAVETYFRDGSWHTRRGDCSRPFASGARREHLITVGVDVARWNGLSHIIRDTDGTIVEINVYVTEAGRHNSARSLNSTFDMSPSPEVRRPTPSRPTVH